MNYISQCISGISNENIRWTLYGRVSTLKFSPGLSSMSRLDIIWSRWYLLLKNSNKISKWLWYPYFKKFQIWSKFQMITISLIENLMGISGFSISKIKTIVIPSILFFCFGLLEKSVIEIRKEAKIPFIFNHLDRTPSY